jgi:hypothetical protein
MWWSLPAWRRVTVPAVEILSVRTRSRVSVLRVSVSRLPGVALGRAAQVAAAGLAAGQCLQLGDGVGLAGLGCEPLLQGLLKSFGFALGLQVVRLAVLLPDAQAAQLVLETLAAATASGQPGGEHHAVAGQGRGGRAVGGHGGPEGGEHDRAGDPVVRGDGQGVPGVVIEPGQDLGAGPVRERVAGEAGLPALVRLLSFEPDAGGFVRLRGSATTNPRRVRYRLMVAGDTRARWWRSRCQAIVAGPASRPCSVARHAIIRPRRHASATAR